MIEYIKKNRIRLIISIVISFILISSFSGINVSMQMKTDVDTQGSINIYTLKYSFSEFTEDNVYSYDINLNTDYKNVDFRFRQIGLSTIRMDLYKYPAVYIKSAKVTFGPIVIKEYDYTELASRVVHVEGTESLEDEECLKFSDIDGFASTMLNMDSKRVSIMQYLFYFLALIICSIVAYVISKGLSRVGVCLSNTNRFKALLCIVSLALLISANIPIFSRILNTDEELYTKQSYVNRADCISGTFSGNFEAHSDTINKLSIRVADTFDGNKVNSVEVLIDNRLCEAKPFVEKKDSKVFISIDVSNYTFEGGRTYEVLLRSKADADIEGIVANNDGTLKISQVYPFRYKGLLGLLLVLVDILVVGFIAWIYKHDFSNKAMAIFAVAIGVFTAVLITPVKINDEYRHFIRAYSYSEGNFKIQREHGLPDGMTGVSYPNEQGDFSFVMVPSSIDNIKYLDEYDNYYDGGYASEVSNNTCYNELFYQMKQGDDGIKHPVSTAGVEVISPLAYLPQILMILLGKLFGQTGVVLFFLARIGNVLCGVGLLYLASRFAPEYGIPIWLSGLVPFTMILRSSCNTDALSIPLIVFLSAYLLHFVHDKMPLKIRDWLIVIVATLWISVVKLPFILPVGLILLFRDDNYNHKINGAKRRIANVVIPILIVALACVFYKSDSNIFAPIPSETAVSEASSTEVKEQSADSNSDNISFLIHNPIKVAKFMFEEFESLLYRAPNWLLSYNEIGSLFIWLLLLPLLLVKRNRYYERIYIFFIACLMWLAVLSVFYLMSGVSVFPLPGVGSRYILPIIPLLLLALPQGNEQTERVAVIIYPFIGIVATGINIILLFRIFL